MATAISSRGVEGDFSPAGPVKGKKGSSPAKQSTTGRDKVQVSGEAKSLFEADQSKRLEEIRKRLNDGFHMSPKVTEKIVDGLMDDLHDTPR
jgi:anti-sigma28 factor (negative regulator of flagellin synthesis)